MTRNPEDPTAASAVTNPDIRLSQITAGKLSWHKRQGFRGFSSSDVGLRHHRIRFFAFSQSHSMRWSPDITKRCGILVCQVSVSSKEKTRQTTRTQFLENPSPQQQSTSISGCNGLYRPPRVPPRQFRTCRAATAALLGSDRQNLQAGNKHHT